MHKQHRDSIGVARGFPVNTVSPRHVQHAAGIRLDGRMQRGIQYDLSYENVSLDCIALARKAGVA